MLFTPPAVMIGGKPEISHEYSSLDNASPFSFSSVPFGATHVRREIFVAAILFGNGGDRTINAMTIGGVSAVAHQQSAGAASSTTRSGLFSAPVPTGTTGTIDITLSGAAFYVMISVYRVIRRVNFGATGTYDFVSLSSGSTTSLSTTALEIPNKGFAFSSIRMATNAAPSVSGAGLTIDASNSGNPSHTTYIAGAPVATSTSSPTMTWSWSGSVSADAWAWSIL
jgi:hypothetical protein